MKFESVVGIVQLFVVSFPYLNCSIQIPPTWKCEEKLTLNWLWNLRNNNRCVNIIIESIHLPKCFYDQIFHSKFMVQFHGISSIKTRNALVLSPTNCDNFIFFLKNSNEALDLFKTNRTDLTKRFVPFSQLFLVISDDVKFDQRALDYIYENGLFVFAVKSSISTTDASSNELNFQSLKNILTEGMLDLTASNRIDAIRYFGTYKDHPFLSHKFKEKVFRVSLFRCVPYVMYLPDGAFDGLQYRTIKEIIKPWKIEHNKCDFSPTISVPWNTVLYNVNDNISDLAMCSIWMTKPLSQYDPSTYFDLQCGTFLVPKPHLLNPASYLYMSLSASDWYGFAVSLIVMTLSFSIITKIGRRFIGSWSDLMYDSFSRSLMDALDMATSHGLAKFPKEHSMKFLLNRFGNGTLL